MSEIRSQATPARDELAEVLMKLWGWLGPDAAKMLVEQVEAAGWSKPRTVNSAAEAEALAEGSVILDARGEVLHWIDRGDYLQWSDIWGNECGADYPATVLFTLGDAG